MKKRRIVVLAFLLFACLSLGVGYAALTDSFTVSGDLGANIDNNNLVVVFDGIDTDSNNAISSVDDTYCKFATSSGVTAIDGRTTVELAISGLTTKGNKAWAKLVVVNRSTAAKANELDATLSDPSVNYKDVDQDMFKITANWQTIEGANLADRVLGIGEVAVIYIEIELLETPTSSVTATGFEVTFSATTN